MMYKGKKIEFPSFSQTSFFKIIEGLEKQLNDPDLILREHASKLLEEVNQYPELRDGIGEGKSLTKYRKTIDKLTGLLFPKVLTTNEIKVVTPPFSFDPLRSSARFDSIVKASGETFEFGMKDVDEDLFYLYGCFSILAAYYGFNVAGSTPQMMEIYNKDQDIYRSYKVLINMDLCEFVPTEKAPEITRSDFENLLENLYDIGLWKNKFPPNSWIMKGVMLISLVDVTIDQSIAGVASNLFDKSTESFENVLSSIRTLLNNSSLSLGLLMVSNEQLHAIDKAEGMAGIVLKPGEMLDGRSDLCERSFEILFKNNEPLVISDVKKFHETSQSKFSERLLKTGLNSYISIPLVYEDELLSFFELGSEKRFDLHMGTIAVLDEIIPMLAMANKRYVTEEENLIEAIIQRECTTIHPSVKWRFHDEACKFITQQQKGEQPVFRDIIFKELYPLYGQMDIKGSSERRNKAVSQDLIKQIRGVEKVLKIAIRKNALPALEELMFRLNKVKKELENDLEAGSEHRLTTFLEADVYPVLTYLASTGKQLKDQVDEYFGMLDPELRTVYEERKIFDQTVNQINQRLASYLDQKQTEAQQMFPHYFERYKTDGIEYNMYIGQSITKNEKFDQIYLRNLRLWQLGVMCEMENEFKAMQDQFHTNIEIASLILVYNTSISVHFRMDEKQFDVEGAYNARYEIIKKRVDKAHVKGTKDRITKPGHLVIVYSQEQDALEYRTYLDFLAAKGYVDTEYEDLELEDLQGVHGLKALRVPVAYNARTDVDQLLKEVESGVIN